jgi:hypothetical protein
MPEHLWIFAPSGLGDRYTKPSLIIQLTQATITSPSQASGLHQQVKITRFPSATSTAIDFNSAIASVTSPVSFHAFTWGHSH